MTNHFLRAQMWLPLPIEAAFGFFGDVANLGKITPPSVRFQTITPMPITMCAGAIVEHRLWIHHIPIRWRTEITEWQPPAFFVDVQRRGPYKIWIHRHEFEEAEGGTWVRDHVEYRARGWFCEPIVNRILVAPDLRSIFGHRHKVIRELLAAGSDSTGDRVECT